jgi:hypothetical protein
MFLTTQLLDEINRANASPRYRSEIKQDQSNFASFGRIAPVAR